MGASTNPLLSVEITFPSVKRLLLMLVVSLRCCTYNIWLFMVGNIRAMVRMRLDVRMQLMPKDLALGAGVA